VKSARDGVLVWNGLVAEPPRLARRGELAQEEGRPPARAAGAVDVPDVTALVKAYPAAPSSPVRASSAAKARR
jgi:hypothetical protein